MAGTCPQQAVPRPAESAPSSSNRAESFAAYLARLSAAEWDDVLQRVHAVDAAEHAAALHHLVMILDGYHDVARIHDLQRAVVQATPPNTSASRVATHAVFALALRDTLSAREFAALYGPFARPDPASHATRPHTAGAHDVDGSYGADRRVAVTALTDVAGALAAL